MKFITNQNYLILCGGKAANECCETYNMHEINHIVAAITLGQRGLKILDITNNQCEVKSLHYLNYLCCLLVCKMYLSQYYIFTCHFIFNLFKIFLKLPQKFNCSRLNINL